MVCLVLLLLEFSSLTLTLLDFASGGGKKLNSDVSETDSVSQDSAARSSPRKRQASSPSPQSTPKGKKSRLTRGDLKSTESDQEIVPSPTASGDAKKPQPKKQDPPAKKANVRNVRRTKPMSNGTSDGEDTAETDSPTSPRKSAALSRAIQTVGKGQEEEDVGVKRKTRSSRK